MTPPSRIAVYKISYNTTASTESRRQNEHDACLPTILSVDPRLVSRSYGCLFGRFASDADGCPAASIWLHLPVIAPKPSPRCARNARPERSGCDAARVVI